MRDDEIRARLREQNLWWRAVASGGDPLAWAQTDPTLRSRSAFDLGYRSDCLDDVATGQIDDKLVILRGPRRIGKSVLLKDTIATLCGRRAVAEYHRNGAVSDVFLQDLAAWLHRDVDPAAAEDSVPRLVAELQERSTAPLNRNDMAQALGYANRQTFDLRLNRLVRTIEGKFARGVLATRTITDLQHPAWAVPAPLVALLLN